VLLGIDIGTTATKALLLDPARGVVAVGSRETRLRSPRPGWAEEDTDAWWANLASLARELAAGQRIAAVGVSGMVPCVILVDDELRALRPSIQQNDARAGPQIATLRERLRGARVSARTGAAITQQSVGPKLLWLQEHEPDVWAAGAHVLGSYDLMTALLTGTLQVEANWALESGLFDLETGDWAPDILAAAGVAPGRLPAVRSPALVVGGVTAPAAAQSGLPEGVPVVAGSADHVAAAFAAGVVSPGDVLIKLGGAGDILAVSETPVVDERLFLDLHLVPGLYLPNGCMATSGSLVRWFQSELGDGASLAELDEAAARVPAAADGIVALPYFLGEKTPLQDPDARGAFIGLHLGHSRAHLYRAVLEAVAFGFRHHLDVFAELGLPVTTVRIGDGGAKSRLWTQIVADVIGRPLEVVSGGGAALGAAFLAGMATGAFHDWQQIRTFLTIEGRVTPAASRDYERPYAVYRRLYPALREVTAA
jgi:xylulokinase